MPIVQANGLSLYYVEHGWGEPLLLLHGLGSRAADWALQFPSFAAEYRVIAPDLRGHGESDKPPGPYSIAQMAADVAALLGALEATPAHVAGLSMGGMVALQLAVDRPDVVRRLVVVNSVPALVPRTMRERMRLGSRVVMAELFGPRLTGQLLSRRLFPAPDQAAFREAMVQQWASNDPKAYRAALRACVGWSIVDRLEEVRAPVLLISGDADYLPLDAKLACVERLADGRLLVIPDSGHATPVDQTDLFNETVLDFLRADA
jgi:pimeloyl-ACP methyl ester carboxylesterase